MTSFEERLRQARERAKQMDAPASWQDTKTNTFQQTVNNDLNKTGNTIAQQQRNQKSAQIAARAGGSLMEKATVETPKQSPFKTVFDVVDRGAGYFNQGIASTVDLVANALPRLEGAVFGTKPEATFTGQILKPVTDATGKFKDWVDQTVANIDQRVQNDTKDNKAANIAANLGSQTVAALPNAVLAFLSGGGSAATQLAAQPTGISGAVTSAATKALQNPLTGVSFAQSLGQSYEEAKASGASDVEAMTAATLSSLFNAAIETGGGIEALPGEIRGKDLSTAQKALEWVKSALEEGGEEVVQGVITNMTNKGIFDADKPLVSTTDENAVVNPYRMLQEFGSGAAVGGLLGGGQMLGNALMGMGNGRIATEPAAPRNDSVKPTPQRPTVESVMPKLQQSTQTTGNEQVAQMVQSMTGQNKNAPVNKTETESIKQPKAEQTADVASNPNVYVQNENARAFGDSSIPNPKETVNGGNVGDIGAKTSDFRHEVKKSQTHGIDAVEDMLGVPEDQRKEYVHDVVTEQESLYNANLRLEQDYEGEKNYLRNTLQWTGEDVDTAHQILEDLEREAAAAGTEEAWDNYHEWRDIVQKHESSLGGGLQAIAKYARKTGSKIVQRASEAIMDARDGTDRAETMNTVADYAKQYDKAVGKKDVDSLLQIIRDTSVTRRTGSLRHNELSKTMNWALDRIAEYAKAELANPKKVEVTENTPVVPQVNYTVKVGDKVTVSDRNNFGTVTSVNDDGTYTVHFKSRQGSEATKTFSGDMVTKLGHKTTVVSNTATIQEVGRFYSFLENFAASGIEAIATDKQKTSFGKAVLTIRRNAMLSKAATIMRNLVGNNVFDPLDSVANNMSVPLDMLLSTITGTRSVAVDKSWFSEAKRKGSLDALAMAMLEVGLDVNAGGAESKYETKGTRTFHMANGPFSKLMSQWEKYMGYAMNATDEFQKGGIAAETQRGIDRLYEQGKIKDDTLRNAGEKEALYRTFQDESIPAQMTQGLRQVGNILHAGDIGAGDALIPFAQVPANLPARVADYSPVGLARGIGKMAKVLYDAKKGNLTAAQQASAVKDIGRGITGSGMIAAAAALAAKGIIRVVNPGGEDENKDKAASEKAQGLNGTQWNLSATIRAENGESAEWQDGDTVMSIAFLDPINGMLTTGALLAEDYKEARKNGDKLGVRDVLADSLSGTIQSFLDLPVMQTMRDVYNAYQYSDGERPVEKLGDMATAFVSSMATSFIPNALKGLAQGLDPYQRDLYAKDDLLGQTIDQMIGSVPGMRDRLTAKQDVYGNDVKNPDQPLNFLNSNILPGAITTYTETDLMRVLDDLAEQTGSNAAYLSKSAPKTVTVGDETVALSKDQQRQFMTERGKVYEAASAAIQDSGKFQKLSKEMQLKVYEYAEKFATQAAKAALGIGYEIDTKWMREIASKSADWQANAIIDRAIENAKK